MQIQQQPQALYARHNLCKSWSFETRTVKGKRKGAHLWLLQRIKLNGDMRDNIYQHTNAVKSIPEVKKDDVEAGNVTSLWFLGGLVML